MIGNRVPRQRFICNHNCEIKLQYYCTDWHIITIETYLFSMMITMGLRLCFGLQWVRRGTTKSTIATEAYSAASMMLLFGQLYSAACLQLLCSQGFGWSKLRQQILKATWAFMADIKILEKSHWDTGPLLRISAMNYHLSATFLLQHQEEQEGLVVTKE